MIIDGEKCVEESASAFDRPCAQVVEFILGRLTCILARLWCPGRWRVERSTSDPLGCDEDAGVDSLGHTLVGISGWLRWTSSRSAATSMFPIDRSWSA